MTCWYGQLSHRIYWYQMQEKKGMDRNNSPPPDKCIMANTGAIWQQAAHITTSHDLLAAQKQPQKKKASSKQKCPRIFWKKVVRMEN